MRYIFGEYRFSDVIPNIGSWKKVLIDADRIVVDEVSELKKRNNTIVHANDTHFDTTKQQGPTAPAHSVYLNLDK